MESWVFWIAVILILVMVFDEFRPKCPRGSFRQMKLKMKYKRWH